MNIIQNKIKAWQWLVVLGCSLGACKKNIETVLPDGQQDIRVNYFSASDILPDIDSNVNITLLRNGTLYQQHQTAFRFEFDYDWHVYPSAYQYTDDREITYARYASNAYHYIFSIGNQTLIDTLLELKPVTYHCMYLADAPTAQGAAPQYRFLSVTEPRGGIPDEKVGVRFINLTPEASLIQAVFVPGNGTDKSLSTIGSLHASEYSYLDPIDAKDGLLRFRLVDNEGDALYTAVPAVAGRSYAIIVQGFKSEQRRQVANNSGQGNSTVTVSANLRSIVRRTY